MRELYGRPHPDPREVVRRIVAALDPETREHMKAPAVVTCLGVLLEGSRLVSEMGMINALASLGVGSEPAAVQMAAGLRGRAEGLIAAAEQASRFGDLALEAVGTTAMAIATLHDAGAELLGVPLSVAEANFAGFHREGRHAELAGSFLRHDLDRAFRHFISRDLADFIGGEGVPTVGHASRLEDAAAREGREDLVGLDLARWRGEVAQAASAPPRVWPAMLGPALSAGMDSALDVLGGAG